MKKKLLKLINDEVKTTSFIPQLACTAESDSCYQDTCDCDSCPLSEIGCVKLADI